MKDPFGGCRCNQPKLVGGARSGRVSRVPCLFGATSATLKLRLNILLGSEFQYHRCCAGRRSPNHASRHLKVRRRNCFGTLHGACHHCADRADAPGATWTGRSSSSEIAVLEAWELGRPHAEFTAPSASQLKTHAFFNSLVPDL